MSGVGFWCVMYVLHMLTFVALFRLQAETGLVPLWLAMLVAATCGCSGWCLARAVELRRGWRRGPLP